MPKVSIIIPVYNVEQYLQDCIDSLVKQTLEDTELIFVNDASPDNSLAILHENQKKYPDRIVVIDSKVNLRQGGARNLGLQRATADYVGFVDSDDFVSPMMYQGLYEKAVETDADAVFMSAVCMPMTAEYGNVNFSDPGAFAVYFNPQRCRKLEGRELTVADKSEFITHMVGPSVWAGIYKKSVLLDHNLLFPEHLKFEDNYWCALARCYFSKIAVAEGVGYYYRFNQNSTVNKKNTRDFYDRSKVEEMLLDAVKERGLWDDHYEAWEFLFANRYGINTFLKFVTKYDEIPFDSIKELQAEVNEKFPNWRQNKYLKEDKSLKQKIRRIAFSLKPDSALGRLGMKVIAAYFNR